MSDVDRAVSALRDVLEAIQRDPSVSPNLKVALAPVSVEREQFLGGGGLITVKGASEAAVNARAALEAQSYPATAYGTSVAKATRIADGAWTASVRWYSAD